MLTGCTAVFTFFSRSTNGSNPEPPIHIGFTPVVIRERKPVLVMVAAAIYKPPARSDRKGGMD
jgi:hypothetical protein